MHVQRIARPAHLVVLAAVALSAACSDPIAPVSTRGAVGVPAPQAEVLTAAKGPKPNRKSPYISELRLTPPAEVVLGDSWGTQYSVVLVNPSRKPQSNL